MYCRHYKYYRHEHKTGPRTYGSCLHTETADATNANSCACAHFERGGPSLSPHETVSLRARKSRAKVRP